MIPSPRKYFTALLILLATFAGLIPSARAQETATSQLLDLSIGVDDFETIPPMNGEPEFRGDFRKVVHLGYSAKTRELRITPYQQGTAALSIYDSKGKKIADFVLSVKKINVNRVAKEIQSLLGDIEGIQIRIANNR